MTINGPSVGRNNTQDASAKNRGAQKSRFWPHPPEPPPRPYKQGKGRGFSASQGDSVSLAFREKSFRKVHAPFFILKPLAVWRGDFIGVANRPGAESDNVVYRHQHRIFAYMIVVRLTARASRVHLFSYAIFMTKSFGENPKFRQAHTQVTGIPVLIQIHLPSIGKIESFPCHLHHGALERIYFFVIHIPCVFSGVIFHHKLLFVFKYPEHTSIFG